MIYLLIVVLLAIMIVYHYYYRSSPISVETIKSQMIDHNRPKLSFDSLKNYIRQNLITDVIIGPCLGTRHYPTISCNHLVKVIGSNSFSDTIDLYAIDIYEILTLMNKSVPSHIDDAYQQYIEHSKQLEEMRKTDPNVHFD